MFKNLTPQERCTLQSWLRAETTLFDVKKLARTGAVENERFTPRCVRIYTLLWNWSGERFFGEAGRLQDRCYNKRGSEFLKRRIARCSDIIKQLKK